MSTRTVDDGDGYMDTVAIGDAPRAAVTVEIDAKSGRAFITTESLAGILAEIGEMRAHRDHLLEQFQLAQRARSQGDHPSALALVGEAYAILQDMPRDGHRGEQVAAWLEKVRNR